MSNKIKRNAIKAASVGMAAMMAATPLTAFAAEETPVEGQDVVEASKVTQEATGVQETTKASRIATGANTELTDTEELAGKKNEDGSKIEEKAAVDKLAEAQKNLDEMDTQTGKIAGDEKTGAGLVEDITELADQTNKDMKQASNDIADKNNAVNNATSIADAQAASVEAAGIADAAEKNFNAASEKYEDFKKKIETNKGVIKTAREAYETALTNGSNNLASAKAELDAAEQLAIDLQDEADKASAVLAKEGAAAIIAAQEAVDFAEASKDKEIHGAVWLRRDELFAKIIEFYYVPEVLKGSDVELPEEGFVRPKNEQVSENVANGGQQNANYYKVSYKDANGETKTVYLNYKVENNKLLIFAKEKLDVKYYDDSETNKRVFITDEEFEAAKTVENNGEYVLLDNGTSLFTIEPEHKEGKVTVTKTVNNRDAATYTLDKNGKVVETITGEVTTVTKTEKKLDGSGYEYTSENEAKAAAGAEVAKDKGVVTGQVATESKTTYSADVEYVPVFTATVNIDEHIGDYWDTEWDDIEAARAKVVAKYVNYVRNTGAAVLAIGDGVNSVRQSDTWFSDDPYNATGTLTITFSVSSTHHEEVIPTGFFGTLKDAVDFILVDEAAKGRKIAQGKNLQTYVGNADYEFNDGTWWQSTLKYDTADVKNVGSVSSEDKNALGQLAQAKVTEDLASKKNAYADQLTKYGFAVNAVAYTGSTKTVNDSSETLYRYKDVDYTVTETKTANEMVSKKSYEAAKVQHDIGYYDNKNFNEYVANRKENQDKILLFEGTDKEFNDFLGKHTAAVERQATISKQAQEAAKAYGVAKAEVERLQRQLKELQDSADIRATDDMMKAAELQKELEAAQADMDAAKATLDGLTGQLSALATNLANRIAFLTPAPAAPAAPAAVGGAVAVDANVAAAPARLVRVNPVAAPLANNTLDNGDDAAEEDVNLQQVVNSNDVTTALSDMTLEDDAKANTILGWWWLLIVAVLGGTGYTMYRKFQQKKVAEKIDKTK